MECIRGLNEGEFGLEGEVYSALFERYFSLVSEEHDVDFIQRCAAHFDTLEAPIIDHLCRSSIRYCDAFLSEIGEPLIEFATPRDVLKLITPSVMIVPYPEQSTPVVHLELECQWEPEHGMEWIIRENQVLYVGPFNGENPWQGFSPKAAWNFA
ncbi:MULTISPECIES: hypothetical protein [unclassified Halomonas]|uniref:DUF6985 domain-containing protein n=1 Tax=unclassified Halomonas TaxID=2609666 RepID=UPI002076A3AC|nr:MULTISPECIES: hypothetical protein [unclassified Halomonas]